MSEELDKVVAEAKKVMTEAKEEAVKLLHEAHEEVEKLLNEFHAKAKAQEAAEPAKTDTTE